MSMFLNGTKVDTIEQLEQLIVGLQENLKQILRNDFNGVPNVPQTVLPDVTPRQIRQAMVMSGLTMQQIEDALNALPEPNKSMAKIEWEYSIAFKRDRPFVAAVGQILGWTTTQIDDLWRLAGSL